MFCEVRTRVRWMHVQRSEGEGTDARKRRCHMSDRTPGPIEYMLRDIREALQMDVAFVSQFSEDQLVFRAIEGDEESFGWQEGESFPIDESYCKRALDGRIPQVVPDAKGEDATKVLRVSSEADPWLRERDLGLMEGTARWLVEQLERRGGL